MRVNRGRTLAIAIWLALVPSAHAEEPQPVPDTAPNPARTPLADALIYPTYTWDIVGPRFSIQRGPTLLDDSLTADGLAQALERSPTAQKLAQLAHQRLVLGDSLYYGGLAGLLVGVVGVGVGAAQTTDSGAQWGLGSAGAILAAAGLASLVVGLFAMHDGLSKVLAAVNVYNRELAQRSPELTFATSIPPSAAQP